MESLKIRPSLRKALIGTIIFTGILAIIFSHYNLGKEEVLVVQINESGDVQSAFEIQPEKISNDLIESENLPEEINDSNHWFWFLGGAWLAIVLFFIFAIISEKRGK